MRSKHRKVLGYWVYEWALDKSRREGREHHFGRGAIQTACFFLNWGPKILIIRKGELVSLGNAFSIRAAFSLKGKMFYCRPLFLLVKPGDTVFYGSQEVYREYSQRFAHSFVEGTGLTIVV